MPDLSVKNSGLFIFNYSVDILIGIKYCSGNMSNQTSEIETDMKQFEWDTVPSWIPKWSDIKGKAHLYKTARVRANGKFVRLLGVMLFKADKELEEPVFACHFSGSFKVSYLTTEELADFCL